MIFWLLETFFYFFQTAVNCYQWKQFILQLEHIFQSILHSRLVLTSFLFTGNIIVLFWGFFCELKLYLKSRGSQFLKMNHIPASRHQSFFNFFRYFLKREPGFPYFSTSSLSGWWKPIFALVETVFFDQSYSSASGNHYRYLGKMLLLDSCIFG